MFKCIIQPGKGWQWQLLPVTCLALAAKMEETNVPNLLDLQLIEPSRFLFKPKTVQRMELLVMSSLKWRLRTITPFHFVHYFISKISSFNPQCNGFNSVFSRASDLILSTNRGNSLINFSILLLSPFSSIHFTIRFSGILKQWSISWIILRPQ